MTRAASHWPHVCYGEALQRDATLADSRESQHAYNAACCAALAASGQDLDDPQPEETAQDRTARASPHWLQAELERWTKFLDSATAEQRQVVVQTLQHWQTDLDLASVREPAQLDAMPEEERSQWTALWTRVAELLAQAAKEPETISGSLGCRSRSVCTRETRWSFVE